MNPSWCTPTAIETAGLLHFSEKHFSYEVLRNQVGGEGEIIWPDLPLARRYGRRATLWDRLPVEVYVPFPVEGDLL
jgi:hypothetical protein